MGAGMNREFLEARARREIALFRDNFRLVDSRGSAWSLGAESGQKRIVLVAWSPLCHVPENVLGWAEAQLRASGRSDVSLLFVDPERPQDRGLVEQIRPHATNAPVLMDFAQTVSRGFGFQRSGDFLVLEPGSWRVVSRGEAYADSLEEALTPSPPGAIARARLAVARMLRHLRHREPECALHYAEEGTRLDAHLARVLYNTCVACHVHNSGSDVFHGLEDFRKWHAMNRTVLRLGRMPPGGKDPAANECSRWPGSHDPSPEDLSLIANWVERGEPAENGAPDPIPGEIRRAMAKPVPSFGKPGLRWTARSADHVPPEGWQRYMYRQVGPLPRDLYVHAARMNFNGLVTHHIAAFISPTGLPGETIVQEWQGGGTHPFRFATQEIGVAMKMKSWTKVFEWGNQPGVREARPGTVFLLPKGSYLILQQHVESVGKPELNRPELELFLDPHPEGKLRPRKMEFYIENFVIPPGRRDYELVKTLTLDEDSSILSALVHGHYRLARYYFRLILPDGHEQPLCNVPYAQVSTPFSPEFSQPVFAPAGSKIEFHIVYDNSAGNPLNPDPTAAVPEGPLFRDFEMGIAQLTVVPGKLSSSGDLLP
jgi:hypothetical protein